MWINFCLVPRTLEGSVIEMHLIIPQQQFLIIHQWLRSVLSTETGRGPLSALKLHLKAKSAWSRSHWWCCAFQSIAALLLDGQPTSPRLVLLLHFFFQIPQLWPGMHSPYTLPARCFVADECGGTICKHCCVFWWWMFASCLHSVTHLSPQPLQDQPLLYHSR